MPPPPIPPNQANQSYFFTVLNPSATTAPTTTTPPPPPPHARARAPAPPNPLPTDQPPPFTPTQRSLQARGKPYATPSAGEPYEMRQQRDQAANILSSYELLLWYSAARNESISQTRHHFQNILLGLPEEDDTQWREEWEVPVEQRVKRDADTVMGGGASGSSPARTAKGKEKERVKRKA